MIGRDRARQAVATTSRGRSPAVRQAGADAERRNAHRLGDSGGRRLRYRRRQLVGWRRDSPVRRNLRPVRRGACPGHWQSVRLWRAARLDDRPRIRSGSLVRPAGILHPKQRRSGRDLSVRRSRRLDYGQLHARALRRIGHRKQGRRHDAPGAGRPPSASA